MTTTKALSTGAAIAIAVTVLTQTKAQAYCWDTKADGVRSHWTRDVYDKGDWYYLDPEGKVPSVGWECTTARRNALMTAYGIDSGEWASYGYNAGVCDFTTPLTRTIDTLELLEVTKSPGNDLQKLRDLVRGQYGDGNLNADCDNGDATATTFCYLIGANQTDLHLPFFYDKDIVQRASTLAHEAAHKEYGFEIDLSCGRGHSGDCGDDNECDDAYNHGGAYSWSADFHKFFCQQAVNTTTALRYRALSWHNWFLNTKFEDNTYSPNGYTELTACNAASSPHLRDKLYAFWPMNAAGTQTDEVGGKALIQASPSNQLSTTVDGVTGPVGAHNQTHSAQQLSFQSSDGLTTLNAFDLSGPFTIATWARFDPGFWNLNEPGVIAGKWIAQPGGRSFLIRYVVDYSTGLSLLRVTMSTNGNDGWSGDVPFLPVQGKWNQFVVQWADSGTASDGQSTMRITINDQPSTLFTLPGDKVHNGSSPLTVGYRPDGTTLQQLDPWVGTVDSIGFWKRSISAAERVELYNGGVGREFGKKTVVTAQTQYVDLAWWQF